MSDVVVIHRGSLESHTFDFPFMQSMVASLYITYDQLGSTVIEKELADCIFSDNQVTVELGQEDTLKMIPKQKVLIQIRGRLTNNVPIVSNIMQAKVDGELLKEGVV